MVKIYVLYPVAVEISTSVLYYDSMMDVNISIFGNNKRTLRLLTVRRENAWLFAKETALDVSYVLGISKSIWYRNLIIWIT